MWSFASLQTLLQYHTSRHYWNGKLTLMPPTQYACVPDDRPEFVPFKVPRLGAAYDFLGFWSYPSRVGWRVHRFDRWCHEGRCGPGICRDGGHEDVYGLQTPSISKDEGAVSIHEKVAVLQSWLFFGALAEACTISGLPADQSEFSADVFDTAYLNGLPLKLFTAAQRSRRAGSKKLQEKLYAIIRQIQLMITRSSDWEDEHEYDWEQCQVLFSIHILLRTLSLALLSHSPHPHLDQQDTLKFSATDTATEWKPEGQMSMMALTHGRLIAKGWCKVEIWHILQGIDVAAFACAIERPHALQHHEACTDTTCMAYQTSDSDYRTLHVDSNCNCPFLGVEQTDLQNALARNQIPVVFVSDNLSLRVADSEKTTFIAISHVWADGLGNPHQNALPTCQIRRLQHLIAALCRRFNLHKCGRRGPALWIDTLCIPVAPELKEFRKLAIRMLARTYTEASGVLVLDRELCRFESHTASVLELGIRAVCSGWCKRLWTLQEGSLAGTGGGTAEPGTLYIQMADGPAHWNRLSHSFHYKPSRYKAPRPKPSPLLPYVQDIKAELVYGMHLLTAMEDRLPSVHDIRDPRGFETRFEKIARAVQNRSTSKREDEPICMASLLGLDLAEILWADDADIRMATFYRLMRDVPSAIIFSEFGVPDFLTRNLPMVPFRWAPRSLLLLERPMEISLALSAMRFADEPIPGLLGECREDGLHINHSGFVFHRTELTLQSDTLVVEQGSGEQYNLSLSLSDMAPNHIGPVGRCALIFKTKIPSDVVIVHIERIEPGVAHDGSEEY
ncbi:hypothetical protein C8Q74DRAFT_281064 [Fomes fomentarius]|nr:hypothetical protein C8Q74DRAFT_281064 [Fomes fomentarius]